MEVSKVVAVLVAIGHNGLGMGRNLIVIRDADDVVTKCLIAS